MNPQTLREFLDTRPFEPCEVELSSGQVLKIGHPENVIVMPKTLIVATPERDLCQWTSLIHVVGIHKGQLPCLGVPCAQLELPPEPCPDQLQRNARPSPRG